MTPPTSSAWGPAAKRWLKFSVVGAIGIGVQLGALALLNACGLNYLLATALAVEAAVLHNFIWHQSFTWADRATAGLAAVLTRLVRFNFTTGVISIGGNLLLMRVLVGQVHLPVFPANLITIAGCSLANYLANDRMVFVETLTVTSHPAATPRSRAANSTDDGPVLPSAVQPFLPDA